MAWKRFCYISEVTGLTHKYNNHMIVWLALAASSTTPAPRLNRALPFEWLLFQNLFFLAEKFLFFHVEDNGILVEYAYSFLRLILTLPNLDFITAHFSLIAAKMCSVYPPILGPW